MLFYLLEVSTNLLRIYFNSVSSPMLSKRVQLFLFIEYESIKCHSCWRYRPKCISNLHVSIRNLRCSFLHRPLNINQRSESFHFMRSVQKAAEHPVVLRRRDNKCSTTKNREGPRQIETMKNPINEVYNCGMRRFAHPHKLSLSLAHGGAMRKSGYLVKYV